MPQIAHQVAAEGAKRLVIVSDEPDKYPVESTSRPASTVHHRDELDAVQRELREITGLTVLIYDQTCAAEKRRRRKRGLYPDPPKRVFINDLVCEGCGDCSQTSNCVSVQPLETEFGRKRQIDQSNCNKDYSCVEGFCPSFVTVHGGALKRLKNSRGRFRPAVRRSAAADAARALDKPYGILVTGIGGTGVITVGALLGMAAHLEGKGCSALDFTGLAQKNGAVMSHVRIARDAGGLSHRAHRRWRRRPGPRLRHGGVGRPDRAVARRARRHQGLRQRRSCSRPRASCRIPTSTSRSARCRPRCATPSASAICEIIDATGIAATLMGDSIATNLFMLGFAFQKGAIPLSLEALLARHRDQRRRGRDEQAGLHLGPARRARHVARAAA